MKTKPVSVSAAKLIAETFGYDQVVVIARKIGGHGVGLESVATYGKTKEHCDIAARIGDFLKHKVMGWPTN